MRLLFIFLLFTLFSFLLKSQDSVYTRNVIKYLCSEACYGRGYAKSGLSKAEKFIVAELKKQQVSPLFEGKYTQSFYHSVNTFPGRCSIKLNGIVLAPGKDFIPKPACTGAKGKFILIKKDSVTFTSKNNKPAIEITLKDKLTFSVAKQASEICSIELDKSRIKEVPKEIEISLQNKVITKFESKNIGCSIKGKGSSDSLLVFTAHYDHLGGIGKETFFPGANDNASGVSMLLNLIRHYKNNPPKYSIVFIFFAGEEAGLLGSQYFVNNCPVDLNKIKFLVNLDLLGTGEEGIMVVNGAVFEKQFKKLTALNEEKHFVSTIKKRGKAANSDHYWFSEAGVPCFFIYTMGGIKAYHDVYDVEKTLPLTKYKSIFDLLTIFLNEL